MISIYNLNEKYFDIILIRQLGVAVYSEASIARSILTRNDKTFVLTLCILLHPDSDGFM